MAYQLVTATGGSLTSTGTLLEGSYAAGVPLHTVSASITTDMATLAADSAVTMDMTASDHAAVVTADAALLAVSVTGDVLLEVNKSNITTKSLLRKVVAKMIDRMALAP